MLTIKFSAPTLSLSEDVRKNIEKKFGSFDRFAHNSSDTLLVTVTKTTAHQREDTFRVEVRFIDFFAIGEGVDIMVAADTAKAELMREVTHAKAKRVTLLHRGARKLKKLLKRGR